MKFNVDDIEKLKCPICETVHFTNVPNELQPVCRVVFELKEVVASVICNECDSHVKDGLIALVAIDKNKTDFNTLNDKHGTVVNNKAVRTGNYLFVPRSEVSRQIGETHGPYIFTDDATILRATAHQMKQKTFN